MIQANSRVTDSYVNQAILRGYVVPFSAMQILKKLAPPNAKAIVLEHSITSKLEIVGQKRDIATRITPNHIPPNPRKDVARGRPSHMRGIVRRGLQQALGYVRRRHLPHDGNANGMNLHCNPKPYESIEVVLASFGRCAASPGIARTALHHTTLAKPFMPYSV